MNALVNDLADGLGVEAPLSDGAVLAPQTRREHRPEAVLRNI